MINFLSDNNYNLFNIFCPHLDKMFLFLIGTNSSLIIFINLIKNLNFEVQNKKCLF